MSYFFVPNEILRTFKQLYPAVSLQNVEWSWEVPGKIYEAEFELDGKEVEVEIMVTGQHLLTETVVDEIPAAIRDAVNEHYADHKIESCAEVAYSNGDLCYELDLICAAKGNELEVLIREDGLVLLEAVDL